MWWTFWKMPKRAGAFCLLPSMDTTDLMTSCKPFLLGTKLMILSLCVLGLTRPSEAQQADQASTTSSPQAQPPPAQVQPASPPTQPKIPTDSGTTGNSPTVDPKVPQNDRILWTLPNYLTVENASSLPPLSAAQKFKLVAQGTFDPLEFAFLALESGVNQASNTNPTFGQGLKGYGKRYALAFADNTVENFMVAAIYAAPLRQDPRYYQLGKGSVLHRAGYAALRVVVTRSDSGKTQFNFSEILGSGTAAAISNAYHPGPRTVGSSCSVWATQVGWDAVGYEMKEFWPDLHHYLVRRFRKS